MTLGTHEEVTKGDKTYLVVRGVPIVEGVLKNNFVPLDEFGAFAHDWNGVPLVLRHPTENGGSAKHPDVDVQVLGNFYKASVDQTGRRLVGEFWLDKLALASTDEGKELMQKILRNQQIEVSTGYHAHTINEQGSHKTKQYSGIHRNIHPDHIAILPDITGACSIADGCGMNRNDAGECDCSLIANMTGNLPASGAAIFEKVFKKAKADGDSEEVAGKKAWGAVQAAGWHKNKDEKWVKKNDSNEIFSTIRTKLFQFLSQDSSDPAIRRAQHGARSILTKEFKAMTKNDLIKSLLSGLGMTAVFDDDGDETQVHIASKQEAPTSPQLPAEITQLQSLLTEIGGAQALKDSLGVIKNTSEAFAAFGGKEGITTLLQTVKAAGELTAVIQNQAETEKAALVVSLVANSACRIQEVELKTMSLPTLKALNESLQVINYGAMGARVLQNDEDNKPAVMPSVFLAPPRRKRKR